MQKVLLGLLFLCVAGCGGGTTVMQSNGCTPGSTQSCVCDDGRMGAQSCNASGTGYDACRCADAGVPSSPDAQSFVDIPPAARCGDGTCNGMETCMSCPADCGACVARCGDGTCNGVETCANCSGDCGMCSTPRCGDGTCNGAETCTTCSDDCGACPPRCGDSTCNGTETCTTCSGDCGRCLTVCQACSLNTDCPSGSTCGTRSCDGVHGCYPTADPTAGCALIGLEACPRTSAYNLCSTAAECGSYANCNRFGDGRSICSRRCTLASDCPDGPRGATGLTPTCDSVAHVCYLRCTGPGVCPYGLSCFRYSDGTYGYCS